MKTTHAIALATLCASLAGCGGGGGGGGGGDGGSAGGGNPASGGAFNGQSVGALLTFVRELIAGTSETALPVDVDTSALPVDDGGAPAPL
jgi:hypothetical protein